MFLFLVFGGIMAGMLGGLLGIGAGIALIPPKEKLAEKSTVALLRAWNILFKIEGRQAQESA